MMIRRCAEGIIKRGVHTYNIGFNGDDQTQFDASNINELEQLYHEFCRENNFKLNTVNYVEAV